MKTTVHVFSKHETQTLKQSQPQLPQLLILNYSTFNFSTSLLYYNETTKKHSLVNFSLKKVERNQHLQKSVKAKYLSALVLSQTEKIIIIV